MEKCLYRAPLLSAVLLFAGYCENPILVNNEGNLFNYSRLNSAKLNTAAFYSHLIKLKAISHFLFGDASIALHFIAICLQQEV
jgi:hypothetical protein